MVWVSSLKFCECPSLFRMGCQPFYTTNPPERQALLAHKGEASPRLLQVESNQWNSFAEFSPFGEKPCQKHGFQKCKILFCKTQKIHQYCKILKLPNGCTFSVRNSEYLLSAKKHWKKALSTFIVYPEQKGGGNVGEDYKFMKTVSATTYSDDTFLIQFVVFYKCFHTNHSYNNKQSYKQQRLPIFWMSVLGMTNFLSCGASS